MDLSQPKRFSSPEGEIERDYWWTVTLIRIFGHYPITYSPTHQSEVSDDVSSSKSFKAAYRMVKSPIIWSSCLLTGFNIVSCVTIICSIGLGAAFPLELVKMLEGSDGPTNPTGINSKLNPWIYTTEIFLCMLLAINKFSTVKKFTSWINNWYAFEQEFRAEFNAEKIRFQWGRTFNTLYFLISLAASLLQGIFFGTVLKLNSKYYYLALFSVTWVDFTLFMSPTLEDIQIFHMLQTLKYCFAGLRECITRNSEFSQATTESVAVWRKLVTQIRDQVELAGICIKGGMMILVFRTIFVVSMGIKLLTDLNSLSVSVVSTRYYVIMSFFYCGGTYFRLYARVLMAENIYSEERKLRKTILQICDVSKDASVQREIQFLYQIINMEPSCISIGNYFSLDKPLLVTVVVQILTFLITILQFDTGK